MEVSDLGAAISFEQIAPLVIGAAGALIALLVILKAVRVVMGFVRDGGGGGVTVEKSAAPGWEKHTDSGGNVTIVNTRARVPMRDDFESDQDWDDYQHDQRILRERAAKFGPDA